MKHSLKMYKMFYKCHGVLLVLYILLLSVMALDSTPTPYSLAAFTSFGYFWSFGFWVHNWYVIQGYENDTNK